MTKNNGRCLPTYANDHEAVAKKHMTNMTGFKLGLSFRQDQSNIVRTTKTHMMRDVVDFDYLPPYRI